MTRAAAQVQGLVHRGVWWLEGECSINRKN